MHYFFKIIIIKKKSDQVLLGLVSQAQRITQLSNSLRVGLQGQTQSRGPIFFLSLMGGRHVHQEKKRKRRLHQQMTRYLFIPKQWQKKNRVFCFLLKNSFSTYFWLKAPRKHSRDHIKSIHGYGKKIKNHPKIEPFDIKKIILVAGFLTNGYFPSPS